MKKDDLKMVILSGDKREMRAEKISFHFIAPPPTRVEAGYGGASLTRKNGRA